MDGGEYITKKRVFRREERNKEYGRREFEKREVRKSSSMCIAAWIWQAHPLYPLVLLLNRDEYHDRYVMILFWVFFSLRFFFCVQNNLMLFLGDQYANFVLELLDRKVHRPPSPSHSNMNLASFSVNLPS